VGAGLGGCSVKGPASFSMPLEQSPKLHEVSAVVSSLVGWLEQEIKNPKQINNPTILIMRNLLD
jgi:hypothetical protein